MQNVIAKVRKVVIVVLAVPTLAAFIYYGAVARADQDEQLRQGCARDCAKQGRQDSNCVISCMADARGVLPPRWQ